MGLVLKHYVEKLYKLIIEIRALREGENESAGLPQILKLRTFIINLYT